MPLTVPQGDAIVAFRHTVTGDTEEVVCTMGARSGGSTFNTADANRLRLAWTDYILPQIANSVTFLGVVCRLSDGAGGFTIVESPTTSVTTGGGTGAAASINVAFIVRKHTARAGRRGRGRMYIPGVSEANVDPAGNIPAATVTAFNTALTNFRTALGAAVTTVPVDQDPVVPLLLHSNTTDSTRTVSGNTTTVTTVRGAAGPVPDIITNFTLDPKVGTQRRRLR